MKPALTFSGEKCDPEFMSKPIMTSDSFFSRAKELRSHFEDRFRDPRNASGDRFIWDYWHVPGQYTTLRTPAYHFFPKKLYEEFHNQLVWWGRRNLGCHDISPPWMSCYIDGCKQELHGDLPHGPWAFVFSLTPWKKREFKGGETILLREEILNYWRDFDSGDGLEQEHIFDEIQPLFNRLTVFDPRIPHGVREVKGIQDILKGRLVIHGWFVQPRPFIEGPLSPRELQNLIDSLGAELEKLFDQGLEIRGMLSMRFKVSANGEVSEVKALSNSLRPMSGDKRIVRALLKHIAGLVKKHRFHKRKEASFVTLPLIFE